MSIIIFLIVLAVLILVHEFGHFIVAKKSGVRVDEFGLGFPPRLLSKMWRGTLYTLNAIPLGGFVKIFGENEIEVSKELSGVQNESEKNELVKQSFTSKSKYIQAAILTAGVFFNLILAWVLLSWGFMLGVPVSAENIPRGAEFRDSHLAILGVLEESPAEKAELPVGAHIISLASGEDDLAGDSLNVESFQAFIKSHGGEETLLSYSYGDEKKETLITSEYGILEDKTVPAIGVSLDVVGTASLPIHLAIIEGAKRTIILTGVISSSLLGLIVDAFQGEAEISSLAGPVGIVGFVGDAFTLGFSNLLVLTAVISISLAIINILPIPALDGGRLLFLIIEAIRGKPISPRITARAHMIGFLLLILLLVVVTYYDIARLI
jgi:regulator of sigma E protease